MSQSCELKHPDLSPIREYDRRSHVDLIRKPETPWKDKESLTGRVAAAMEELTSQREAIKQGLRPEPYESSADFEDLMVHLEAGMRMNAERTREGLTAFLRDSEGESQLKETRTAFQCLLAQS